MLSSRGRDAPKATASGALADEKATEGSAVGCTITPILVHCVAAVTAERLHNICHTLLTPGFDAVAPARANVAAREMKTAQHVTRRKS
jgi:hypothetical protein